MLLSLLLDGVKVLSPYEDREIKDVTRDSRGNLFGNLFVCVKGVSADGHEFASEAVQNGAAAVLAEHEIENCDVILTDDTKKAYAILCANFFKNPAKRLQLCAVTGTNGKTSTATILKRVLCFCGIETGLISTVEASYRDVSVPLKRTTPDPYLLHSLLLDMADAGVKVVVMEASSHALCQERLFGLRFFAAVFTNLTQDHLDYHQTMENYFSAKAKLFTMTDFAVVNADDKYGRRLLISCGSLPKASFSITDPAADYFADNIVSQKDGVWFTLHSDNMANALSFGIPGRYSVQNCLGAVAVCRRFSLPIMQIAEGLKHVGVIAGRSERCFENLPFTILFDYAHTPDGIENILKSIREYTKGKITILFGCGGDRDREKRAKMGAAAAKYADFLVVTSDNPRTEAPKKIIADILKGIPKNTRFIVIPCRQDAIRYAVTTARSGDTILLAGKGHEKQQTLGDKNIWFDEKKLVEGILRSL